MIQTLDLRIMDQVLYNCADRAQLDYILLGGGGLQYLMGENLKVVWAEFSTLS
jgi:hypothetical protein